MTESTVKLHSQIPVLVLEAHIPAEEVLRNCLSANLAVATVTRINGTIIIKVFDDILSILINTCAVRQIEYTYRLSLNEDVYKRQVHCIGVRVPERSLLPSLLGRFI